MKRILIISALLLAVVFTATADRRRAHLMGRNVAAAGGGGGDPVVETNGLVAFWSARTGVTNTSDASPPSNADGVKSIMDQSSGARFLLSPGGGNAPTYRTAVQNGQPVIRFTSSSSQYFSNSFGSTLDGADISATFTVMASVVATNAAGIFSNLRNGADADSTWVTQTGSGASFAVFKRDNGGTSDTVLGYPTVAGAFWNITYVIITTTCEIYTNNVLCVTDTLDVGSNTFDSFWFGRSGSTYLNGDIGDILVYNLAQDTTQRTSNYNVLKTIWGTP